MLHRSFKSAKCKTSLKLATSRIKLMKNKKGVQMSKMKRDLAQLLESGQDRTARIRVEHLIREEKMVAAYDLIEIYCELIAARLPIIESQNNCPIDLKEAITSVVVASPRCADIPELLDVKKHFTAKYGKEFVTAALELHPGCGVGRLLIEKLSAIASGVQTKVKVLTAIAEEHNIEWDSKSFEEKESKPAEELLNGPSTFKKASGMQADIHKIQAPSSHTHNVSSTDPGVVETTATTHPDSGSSGRDAENLEVGHSFARHDTCSPSRQQDWDMEFEDARSAAQAAAEYAERASMAAGAAAQLSSWGNITSQYSTESQKSTRQSIRHERSGDYTSPKFPGENFANVPVNNSELQNEQLGGVKHHNLDMKKHSTESEEEKMGSYDDYSAAFDEYESKSESYVGPRYDDEGESTYIPSPGRNSPTFASTSTDTWNFTRNTIKSLEKSPLQTHFSLEHNNFSSLFSQSLRKSVEPSESDNVHWTTYDSDTDDSGEEDPQKTTIVRTSTEEQPSS